MNCPGSFIKALGRQSVVVLTSPFRSTTGEVGRNLANALAQFTTQGLSVLLGIKPASDARVLRWGVQPANVSSFYLFL